MEQALSRAVRAYHALQEAENELYSRIKGHNVDNAEPEVDEKLYDDIRDLVVTAWDAVDGLPLSDEDQEELDCIWEDFAEDRLEATRVPHLAKGAGA